MQTAAHTAPSQIAICDTTLRVCCGAWTHTLTQQNRTLAQVSRTLMHTGEQEIRVKEVDAIDPK